jgi:hypothetical protein
MGSRTRSVNSLRGLIRTLPRELIGNKRINHRFGGHSGTSPRATLPGSSSDGFYTFHICLDGSDPTISSEPGGIRSSFTGFFFDVDKHPIQVIDNPWMTGGLAIDDLVEAAAANRPWT